MNKWINILKKFIIAPFILYIYNLIALPLNIIIPINIFTILIVGIFGIPGLLILLIFKMTF